MTPQSLVKTGYSPSPEPRCRTYILCCSYHGMHWRSECNSAKSLRTGIVRSRCAPRGKSLDVTTKANCVAAPKSIRLLIKRRRTVHFRGCSGGVYTCRLGYTHVCIGTVHHWTGVYLSSLERWAPKAVSTQWRIGRKCWIGSHVMTKNSRNTIISMQN